jgi:D-alanine--poly(phosphoribitol) ligase subunit 1
MKQYQYNLGIRFKQVVELHDERLAIWFNEEDCVSYRELNRTALRVAGFFQGCGIATGNVVCIAGYKTIHTFAAMLACLYIGAPYVMLDPDSPAERLRKIMNTCRPRLILAEQTLLDMLNPVIAELSIAAESPEEFSARLDGFDPVEHLQPNEITGAAPAYIMYTSGSTGFPKGAVMTHANVLNLIAWGQDTFRITHNDILTNVNPLYFDNSVFDFYITLFSGACLVPLDKEEVRDPRRLIDKVAAASCTVWFSVPSLLIFLQTMKATDGKNLSGVRTFIFGGEGYPKAKLKLLYDAYKGSSRFFNVYGPTECTCICSAYALSDLDFEDLQGLPPLGTLAENFDYLILNDNDLPVQSGDSGELCLMGPNVGLGYYNDPERTAISFVQNPLNNSYREYMYRTGDLVRWDTADGRLHIHGRKDNQVKHMGYRIELEEVEAALHCLEYVDEASVIHQTAGGLSRLLAVVVFRGDHDDSQIRHDLQKIIPDYMIPIEYVRVDVLPKNSNGKIDRRLLRGKYSNSSTDSRPA